MSAFGLGPDDLAGIFRRRPRTVRPRGRRRRRWPWIILAAVLILGASAESLMQLRVSFLFLDTLGHSNVFWTPVVAQLVLFLIGFVAATLLVGANIPLWRAAARRLDASGPRVATIGGAVLAVIAGIVAGSSLAGSWQDVLLWLHGHPFHASDPYFHQDYSFFLFSLPVYDVLQGIGWGVVVVSFLVTTAIAVLALSIELTPNEVPLPFQLPSAGGARGAFRVSVLHAGGLLALVFVLASLGAHFGAYHLATDDHTTWVGLDATERAVTRPVLSILQWLALVLAAATVVLVVLRARRRGGEIATAVVLGGLLGGWLLVAGLMQSIPAAIYTGVSVNPNAEAAQRPTISDFLSTSRYAWALQQADVDVRQFGLPGQPGVPESLTLQDLTADPQTLANVRIQDARQLPDDFNQIDRSRAYQSYPTVTVDRYKDPLGHDVEVMLSPREIAEGDIPSSTFVNTSLVYTHGYGDIAVSATNTNGGLPQVLAQQPPRSGFTIPALAPPDLNFENNANADLGIYCGQSTSQPVVANTQQAEFDYLSDAGEHDSHGGGTVGIRNPGFLDRLSLSLTQFNGFDFYLTDTLTAQSTVLLHRTITDRIQTLAPFLTVDGDPYIVDDPATGHIMWIADAYVKSSRFPEAYRTDDGTSYMRNAVKAVVDARTCQTTLYAVDPTEPLTAAYSEIFPGLLQPLSSMPMSLRAHLRYPEDLLQAQAQAYAVVHVTDPDVLYSRSDQWRIADELTTDQQTQPSQATYVEMTLPGNSTPEFVLLQTFSPATQGQSSSANNMTSWLAAQCDYTHTDHPKLVAVRLNNNSNVMGPLQFDNKINVNQAISSEISLLNRSGSQVSLGNVIVLPFNNQSFLYVRPLYVRATGTSGNSYPVLDRVIVGGGQSTGVADGSTFAQALQSLLGTSSPIPGLGASSGGQPSPSPSPSPGASPSPSPSASGTVSAQVQRLLQQIAALRADAVQAKGSGDIVRYVRDQDQIDALLLQVQQLLGISATPSAAAATPAPSPSAAPSPT